jgi:hypothetical protein
MKCNLFTFTLLYYNFGVKSINSFLSHRHWRFFL